MTGYAGPLPPKQFNLTRYCLEEKAGNTPDKTALIVARSADGSVSDEVWTYGTLQRSVLAFAAGLRGTGLPARGHVFIRMGNSVDFALAFFGCIAAGLVPIPASSMLTEAEVAFIVDDASACAVLHDGSLALPDLDPSVRVLGPETIARLHALEPGPYADTKADDPAYLLYTSGTSGRPKGVLHAQRSVWGRRPIYKGWYDMRSDDILVHTGAFNWSYTIGAGLLDPWANGATSVLYTGEKSATVWPALVNRVGATLLASVPALYRQLLKYCELTPETFPHLRHALAAGEALSPSIARAWEDETGLCLYEALGMSEISTYVSSSPHVPPKAGSPGKPQAERSVAILPLDSASTTPCLPGVEGLIAVHRSDPGLMLGYWNRAASETEVFRGDWFCGGDTGYLDEDGYLWFSGRANDVMNAFGYRVSPLEVEAALASHENVGEVAVTELQKDNDVSVIAAFVVPTGHLEEAELLRHASRSLAEYKLPREVHFVSALPHTANGKVRREALRNLVPAK